MEGEIASREGGREKGDQDGRRRRRSGDDRSVVILIFLPRRKLKRGKKRKRNKNWGEVLEDRARLYSAGGTGGGVSMEFGIKILMVK